MPICVCYTAVDMVGGLPFWAAEGGFTMSANIRAHTYMQSIVLFHLTVADHPLAAATLVRARGSKMHEVS